MNRLISIALVCLLQVSLAVASTFNLRVEVTPNGAGSLNTSGGTYEEGSAVNLRTSGHTGYVFKGWYEGETLLSSATNFNYTMPSNDAVVQARYEFDPSVPGNPAMLDTTTYYSFTSTISPVGAGTLNTYSGRYAAGATVNMRAYVNTGYQFVGWQNDSGETVATSTSFNYTMPRRDAQLTALYVYDPSVPANPDSMGTRYTVTVACKPVGGGTFNTTSVTQGEGSSVRLYAYTNTGYRFLRWENEQGEIIATAQNFDYITPHGNSKVYGIFEFDPAPPANPAKNYWNKELGEVIIDDFTTGSLGSAVSQAISGSSANDVAMITVAGVMNNNDFGIANNYNNCTLLDLSRVTGVTIVPSYAFDNTSLENVYLSASIERIGQRAFYGCKQLSALTIYAMTPPVLESNVFTDIPDGLIIYVPAAAIAQYQDADGWKDFTILPIQEDIRSITVSLPDGSTAIDYAKMWLELTNTRSGQRIHYVMTDRTQYTFANIIRNTSWNIVIRNERGDVFGRIDNVEVKDEDVAVTFSSLLKPQSLSLQVVVGDASERRDDVTITWIDSQGNYLAQGATLTGLCPGMPLSYRIQLSQELAMQYETPADGTLTVTDGTDLVSVCLQPIGEVTLTGKVKDLVTGMALSGATISASQTFGGKYTKTINAKTDSKGEYTLTIAAVPTLLAFAATDYISQNVDVDAATLGSVAHYVVPDVSLKGITGATITIGFTYTTVEGETQSWYSDYQNVGYTLFNVTKNRAISQYNVQYPQIVLLEEVDDGDVLRLTAISRTTNYTNGTNVGAFMPVTTTATIAEQKAEATFAITELGRIEGEYTQSGNANVVASLYDTNGKLLKTYDYSNGLLIISNLADGQYTLVSMGSSQFFNSIYDLAQLPQTGLVQDTDYVQHTVTVKSGEVTPVKIDLVPKLDESKFYYTGSGTSFTVNKPSIVAGNYLTLTGRIDFKSAYATTVSNVQMIVDLPESCQFVENSVMVGNGTSTYTLNGHQLVIPMVRYTDRVRFCVIPTLGGEYAPSAFVQFDLNGKTVNQPIGSANYHVKDLSISVPSVVSKPIVPVNGTAVGKSQVDIYDNGVLVGQTTSLANGTWATKVELDRPFNLSEHTIHARYQTERGTEVQTTTQTVLYDMNAIQVSKVIMYHDNPELRKTYKVVFDFLNPSSVAQKYTYYIYNKQFTFTISFTDNDPEKITDVQLLVETGLGNNRILNAVFDEKQDLWVANGEFGNRYDGDIPVNVAVKYSFETPFMADKDELNEKWNAIKDFEQYQEEFVDSIRQIQDEIAEDSIATERFIAGIEQLSEQITEEYGKSEPDYALIDSLYIELMRMCGKNISEQDFIGDIPDVINQDYIESLLSEVDNRLAEDENEIDELISKNDAFLATLDNKSIIDEALLSESMVTPIVGDTLVFYDENNAKQCLYVVEYDAFDFSAVDTLSFEHIKMTTGNDILFNYIEGRFAIIDKDNSRVIVYESEAVPLLARPDKINSEDVVDFIMKEINKIQKCIEGVLVWKEETVTPLNKEIDKLATKILNAESSIKEMEESITVLEGSKLNNRKLLDELLRTQKNLSDKDLDFADDLNDRIRKLEKKIGEQIERLKNLNVKKKNLESELKTLKSNKWIKVQQINTVLEIADVVYKTYHLIKYGYSAIDDMKRWNNFIESILPCPNDHYNAVNLVDLAEGNKSEIRWHYIAAFSFSAITTAISAVLTFSPSSKLIKPFKKWIYSIINDFINNVADDNFKEGQMLSKHYMNKRKADKKKLKCNENDDDDEEESSDDEDKDDGWTDSGEPDNDYSIDPSGYVYEGVTSNRVQGATATVYYKEIVEDMYGDFHENIVKWDAEEYAQENPLFTDENGYYRWDVPQGLWQVKFEKEGYETTYSEWLPVPPPQLDVNIAMKQNVQPTVKAARAYEDAVEVEFDKYMMTELLTEDNIRVIQDGVEVEGSVELLNEETAPQRSEALPTTETFASKIRFNAAQPFTEQEITLIVSNRVKSYAGIRMQDDYQQVFTIEQEIKQIVSDSLKVVDYGGKAVLTVSVLPASASKGKTLCVKTSSPMILGVETEQAVIGTDGKAEITVSGELPGTAALTFTVEGTDKTAITIARVATPILGDINGDGKVDVSDYIGIANRILGQTPEGFNEQTADVNGDGVIDVSDYIGVANIILTGNIQGK